MRTTLRWLLVVLVVFFAAACFSGRRKTGTNTNVGTGKGDQGGPWSGGEPSPAFVDQGH